ncbi:cell division protein Fic [Pseudomonas putida]|nr:cell division protein Fic [Pseudomonas putida]
MAALKVVVILWERASPRRIQRGGWHRLRRCSRARQLPQVLHLP